MNEAPVQRKSLVLDVNAVLRAADGGNTQRVGRSLIFALHGALRAIKLYPIENATVQKALGEVASQARDILSFEDAIELRISGDVIYVNSTRLRLDLENFASFSHLLSLFRASQVGAIHVAKEVQQRDWMIFLSQFQTPAAEGSSPYDDLMRRLEAAGVSAIWIEMPAGRGGGGGGGGSAKERAKRTYSQSVAITKDLMTSLRLGQAP